MLFLLLIAASRPVAWSRRLSLIVGAVLLALFGARLAVVEHAWLSADRTYRPILAALGRLPQGTKLAVASGPGAVGAGDLPLLHLPTYAIIAVDAFVPTEFTYAGQQPLALTPAFEALALESAPDALWIGLTGADPARRAAALTVLGQYGALAIVDRRPVPALALACLTPLYELPRFRLYEIKPPCGP
jgi:hypothetical protein